MNKKTNISFGTIASWADRANYSKAYYKRAFAGVMPVLGRLSHTQGKPGLRCEDSFIASVKVYARALDSGVKSFFVGADGKWLDQILDGDFVQFSVRGSEMYAHSCRLDGRIYFIEDAKMIELGGYYAE